MLSKSASTSWLFGLLIFILSPSWAQDSSSRYLKQELDYLMTIWPGDYDNQEQVSFDAQAQGRDESEQLRVHGFVHRVDMPSLGEFVLYLEERINDDGLQLHYQRLYSLSSDESARAIRVTPYRVITNLPRKDASEGGGPDLGGLADLEFEQISGCDFLIRRDGELFRAFNNPQECSIEGQLYEREFVVSSEIYGFRERRIAKADDASTSKANFKWHRMQRARWFACMIDVPKNRPERSDHTQHYIRVHDQGGAFKFRHPDGRNMRLLMRNTWSYGMQRETFFIGVFEVSASDKLLVYSWGTPGADRIGLNPGYVRIQCDLDTPENRRLQKGLRPDS